MKYFRIAGVSLHVKFIQRQTLAFPFYIFNTTENTFIYGTWGINSKVLGLEDTFSGV